MTVPRDLSLSQTASSTGSPETTSSQNAALRGATTAFGRPAANGRARNNNMNGALAAATTAGSNRSGTSPARPVVPSLTGESVRSVKSNAARDVPLLNGSNMSNPNLPLPPPQRRLSKSPSQQAASLATARAPPPSLDSSAGNNNGQTRPRTAVTKSPAVPPKPRRLSSYSRNVKKDDTDKPTDSTPIAPTTSLVNMFERKASSPQSTGKKPDPLVIKPSSDLPLKSPKPVRTSGGISSMIQMELENAKSSPAPVANDFAQGTSTVLKNNEPISHVDSPLPISKAMAAPSPPIPPPRKRDPVTGPENRNFETFKSSNTVRGRSMPPSSPLRSNTTEPIPIGRSDKNVTSPTETFSPSSASAKSITAQYNLLHPRKMTPNMTGDQLANAMVASSLASSRQPSPTRPNVEPPPLPTRRHRHHTFSLSRTPSPAKAGMRKTLRQTQSDTSDDEEGEHLYPYSKHKVQKRLGKHPNKHHEGDRKRWRESVTEHERKRYEGVWAANKGLYYSFTPEEQKLFSRAPDSQQVRDIKDAVSDQISNIVVRDIWSRSRLPETVLETVWDLVDHERVGRLSKEEFVVGLWLIDGRLKGKKLPVKVSDSVWRSVKGLQKIKIKK